MMDKCNSLSFSGHTTKWKHAGTPTKCKGTARFMVSFCRGLLEKSHICTHARTHAHTQRMLRGNPLTTNKEYLNQNYSGNRAGIVLKQ